ncbi:MAG: right-handed parallel beta-helix repeat-containing protein [Spirochaetales bacterium]|nr:right-handed parallel beta-helix repeat-containing protein [Spirochaetales bacterium]
MNNPKPFFPFLFLLITTISFPACRISTDPPPDDTEIGDDTPNPDDWTTLTDESTGKTFYLDSGLTVSHTATYSIAGRDGSGSDGEAYNNLQDAMEALDGGDTLFVREGFYSRTGFDPFDPHEIGALDIGPDGNARDYTAVVAYPGEQPVILAEPGKDHYNPDPADEGFDNSSGYYRNPAIGVHGDYLVVSGLKTYGQVVITYASHVLIEKCDLGGGGPRCGQGNVIVLDYDSHDVTIRNNKIHNSCWGENDENGSAVIFYYASAMIENNEFYDNWGGDIYVKDTGGQEGRTMEIRYNFFGPSSVYAGSRGYIDHNQRNEIDIVYVHNNVFLEKASGIQWGTVPGMEMRVFPYNNTFVNCGRDLNAWAPAQELISYNNLLYHDNGPDTYFYSAYTIGDADNNLFWSVAGEVVWRMESSPGIITTSLAEWQDYGGYDGASVYADPGFLNPAGDGPEDFRRQNYSGDVSGSIYGTVCGAYETGAEQIGTIGW